MTIQVGPINIGTGFKPFVIAELSGNHNQSLDRAIKLVELAAEAGADAIKLQTYTADTITLDSDLPDFLISDKNSLWNGSKLYDLYNRAHTPWEWHEPIFKVAQRLGLSCFSSPFDETAVDFLQSLSVPAFKIASFEINHIPLIKKVASTGKPLIISTGMASLSDIDLAVNTARSNGCNNIVLLKCTSSYPASPEHTNIITIPHLRQLFNTEVGISDHTFGIGVSVASVALGSTVIEKHFTFSRSDGGVDSKFSLEPHELKLLCQESHRAWQSIGSIHYGPTVSETSSMQFRRSIYASKSIKVGDIFSNDNIRVVRPGYGAPPVYFNQLLGQKARKNYSFGSPITMSDFYL